MTRKSIDIQKSDKANVLPSQGDFYRKYDDDHPKEDTVSKKENEDKSGGLSYFQLYRYSTLWERFLILIGIILASIGSFGLPYSVVIYGEFTSLLIDRTTGVGTSSPTFILSLFGGGRELTNASKEENIAAIKEDSLAYGIGSLAGGVGEWILIAIALDIFNNVALKQVRFLLRVVHF